jgi:hypothetical protein
MKLDAQTVLEELARIATVAAGILDGEEAKQIITADAMRHIAEPDAQHRFLSMDHYDVDHDHFLGMKKLLMRIERLANVEVNASLWVPVPGQDQVTIALQNGPHHRFYDFGMQQKDTPAEMRSVFETGEVVAVASSDDDSYATALAPVRDSLGDVVAVAEFTAPLDPDAPAWS